MNADDKSLMDMACDERGDLAAYLATLTAQQWLTRSLCPKWTVKDVVAHVVSYEELSGVGLAKRFAKGWIVRANEVGVEEFAPMSPQELLEFLGRHLRPRGLTAGFGGMIALVDGTVHHQDIRRALGHPRTVPADRLERILPLVPGNPRLGAGRRIRGLRLRASDVDWEHGRGQLVTGTGEALLMAMTGRREALADLAGPGRETLAGRVAATY
ncbi:maleylpyruvate isomerase family mycothiol-dependent enzyme [Mycolicibacterium frederiksbergense]|uniref:maleylpyruvate isomerase family mycothiol-dependent enzyme n=1 Tax=Mycolicibacterium frederiksbergense TaxID=117567 RepID=UPI00265C0779|nr:maleylpyruvate isomerase family mycothiol-dependent enzyme [Mycolicibacterium frederiksbergense]MDO0975084.1 maleylpyruvate isomerase family mycothiol-dependent enzyme [Mycolicibacterium frederiksbergense]